MIITHENMTSLKATEVIQQLQRMVLGHGDLPVFSAGDWLEYPYDNVDSVFEVREEMSREKDYGESLTIEHYPKRFVI